MKTIMPYGARTRFGVRRSVRWFYVLIGMAAAAGTVWAQPAPRIGFVYPAGGKQGTSFEVVVGGQFLDESKDVIISGEGITTQILEHDKLPSAQVVDDYRDKLRSVQEELRELRQGDKLPPAQILPTIRKLLNDNGLTEKNLRLMAEYDRKRNDPKQQLNNQIGETVRVKVTVAEGAAVGIHQWRLRTAGGLSNPMRFVVGQHPELRESEPPRQFDLENYRGYSGAAAKRDAPPNPKITFPATINGRILPGEIDEFVFHAKQGQQVVLAMQARHLIPYLADAVPGWFQAVMSLHNEGGYELAHAGGYRFDPDPVVFYKIPADGDYHIRVHDSIYRGREDFVYRLTIGELPFLTGITPLGATAGSEVKLLFHGGNLGTEFTQKYTVPKEPGITLLNATVGGIRSNSIPFQVDTFEEGAEREPNNAFGNAVEVKPPFVVNGQIEAPGDADYYRLKGKGNKNMVFEIYARRLGSPLDATLTVFDSDGKQLDVNDDHEDLAAGLTTHHADSRLSVKLPETGLCVVRVTDTQNQGGPNHSYRLKIEQDEPGFALRATPSSLNARAGGAARVTVHALRAGGYEGPISLRLKKAPPGYELRQAMIPAKENHADVAISVPSTPTEKPVTIEIEGRAEIEGRDQVAAAVPAEDMMQAFLYRHLVPVDALLIDVFAPPEESSP